MKTEKGRSVSELERKKYDRVARDFSSGTPRVKKTSEKEEALHCSTSQEKNARSSVKVFEEGRSVRQRAPQKSKERNTECGKPKARLPGVGQIESGRVEIGAASAAAMLSRRRLREKSDEISFVKSAACRSNRFPLITARRVYSAAPVGRFFSACAFARSARKDPGSHAAPFPGVRHAPRRNGIVRSAGRIGVAKLLHQQCVATMSPAIGAQQETYRRGVLLIRELDNSDSPIRPEYKQPSLEYFEQFHPQPAFSCAVTRSIMQEDG